MTGSSLYSRYVLLTSILSRTSQMAQQLQSLANKILNSPTIKANLQECCIWSQIKPALMIRDVSTRWNSTSELIGQALYLRPALQMLIIMCEHNKVRRVRLQRFQLSEAEWNLLVQIHPLLEVGPLLTLMFLRWHVHIVSSYFSMLWDGFQRTKFHLFTTSFVCLIILLLQNNMYLWPGCNELLNSLYNIVYLWPSLTAFGYFLIQNAY
jgi:hypothetical protein